jgi:hypothetical protein
VLDELVDNNVRGPAQKHRLPVRNGIIRDLSLEIRLVKDPGEKERMTRVERLATDRLE